MILGVLSAFVEASSEKTFCCTWNEIKKRFVVSPEHHFSDGKIEVVARRYFLISQFGLEPRLELYFRNISEQPLKVPTNFPPDNEFFVREGTDGVGIFWWKIYESSFYGVFPLKTNLDRFGWLELQPGEVGRSSAFIAERILVDYTTDADADQLELVDREIRISKYSTVQVEFAVRLHGNHGNIWQGSFSILAGGLRPGASDAWSDLEEEESEEVGGEE